MSKRIVLALDGMSLQGACDLVRICHDRIWGVKVHDLIDLHGSGIIARTLRLASGHNEIKLWADLKLHDIPTTIGLRAAALKAAGYDAISVHASAGAEGLKRAIEHGPAVYAITVLTSMSEAEAFNLYHGSSQSMALELAGTAAESGVIGVVCSARDVAGVKARCGLVRPALNPILIVPGTRSDGVPANDQQRTATPAEAIAAGADRLVIGRQVTASKDPSAALDWLRAEIGEI